MNEHREEKGKSRIVTTQDKAGMQVSMHTQHKQTCSTSELVPVHWSFVPVRRYTVDTEHEVNKQTNTSDYQPSVS